MRRRWKPGEGKLTAHFLLWYGLLRIFLDVYRDHGRTTLGVGRNQYFNGATALIGLALLFVLPPLVARRPAPTGQMGAAGAPCWRTWLLRALFAALVLLSLTIPGAWTPGSLERPSPTGGRPTSQRSLPGSHPTQAEDNSEAGSRYRVERPIENVQPG